MPDTVQMNDEAAALTSLEQLLWPEGPVCPHCAETSRLNRLNGVSTQTGAWKCYACRKPFTVRHGTIFHNSHVPMHVWLQALYLLSATGQRMGSQRLSQILGVSVRTAWHLKGKIASGLEAADAARQGLPPSALVCRAPVADDIGDPQPGRVASAVRYQRFLAALAGIATEETDSQFLQALHRLLPVHQRRSLAPPDSFFVETQLELGLFNEPERQMCGAQFPAQPTQPKA